MHDHEADAFAKRLTALRRMSVDPPVLARPSSRLQRLWREIADQFFPSGHSRPKQ